MDLTPLIPEEHVEVGERAGDKRDVLAAVARLATAVDEKLDRSALLAALLQREALGSTGLGRRIAVPHATVQGLDHTLLFLMTLAEPVSFGSPDGQPVEVVFGLISGRDRHHDQLRALARVARLAMRFDLAKELRDADSPRAVRERLDTLESQLAGV